jgi:hypothetical protein
MSDDKQRKIDDILIAAKNYIFPLLDKKKTGNFELTIELNINNGGIRDAYFRSQARERI